MSVLPYRIVLRRQKRLALCDRCPCCDSLFQPLVALTLQYPVLSALSASICRISLAVSAFRIMWYYLYNFTSIFPAPESDCPSPLSSNRAYRSSSSAPPPQNKRHVPPYLYHKVGTCRYIIMILSRQSHQAMQPSAKLLRLAFSFCWLRLAMISLLRPIRLVLKWKNGRSGTVKISTGRM